LSEGDGDVGGVAEARIKKQIGTRFDRFRAHLDLINVERRFPFAENGRIGAKSDAAPETARTGAKIGLGGKRSIEKIFVLIFRFRSDGVDLVDFFLNVSLISQPGAGTRTQSVGGEDGGSDLLQQIRNLANAFRRHFSDADASLRIRGGLIETSELGSEFGAGDQSAGIVFGAVDAQSGSQPLNAGCQGILADAHRRHDRVACQISKRTLNNHNRPLSL